MLWSWHKYKFADQRNRIESSETNQYIYVQLILDKDAKTIQWGKNCLFNNQCWDKSLITWNSKRLVKGSDKTHRLPETGECGFLCTSCLPLTLVFGCWLCFTFLVLIWKYQSWGQDVKQSKEAWKRYSRSREIITTWKWTYTTGKN